MLSWHRALAEQFGRCNDEAAARVLLFARSLLLALLSREYISSS